MYTLFFDICIIADDTKWHILQANAIHDPTTNSQKKIKHEYIFSIAYNLNDENYENLISDEILLQCLAELG